MIGDTLTESPSDVAVEQDPLTAGADGDAVLIEAGKRRPPRRSSSCGCARRRMVYVGVGALAVGAIGARLLVK